MNRLPLFVVLAAVLAFFAPFVGRRTFSTVPGHQSFIYPWAAWPNGLAFSPQCDQAEAFVPWHAFLSRSLRAGEVPFWNPYGFGGHPFFSNGQSAMMSPLRWLTLPWADPHLAHDLSSLVMLLGGALLQYGLLASLGCHAWAASLGAVTWSLCAFNLGWLHLDPIAPVLIFTPLSAWTTRAALSRPSAGRFAAAALAVAGGLTAGHVPMLLASVAGGVAFGALAVLMEIRGPRAAAVLVGRTLAIGAAGVLLGAPALLPTLLTIFGSTREPLSPEAALAGNAVPLSGLAAFLRAPAVATMHSMHALAYVGWVPLGLAILGLARRRPGRSAAVLLLAVLLLLIHGSPLLTVAYRVAPSLAVFRPMGRLYVLTSFTLSVLAAWGLHNVLGRAGRAAVSRAHLAGGIAVALSALDLSVTGWRLNPRPAPRIADDLFPATPLVLELQAIGARMPSGWMRIAPINRGSEAFSPPILLAAIPMMFQIDSIGGYDSLVPRPVVQTLRRLEGEPLHAVLRATPTTSYRPWLKTTRTPLELLPRLGVSHLVLPPGASADAVWPARVAAAGLTVDTAYDGEDGEVLALRDPGTPWIVCAATVAASSTDALAAFLDPGFPYRAQVLLESAGGSAAPETCRPRPARLVRRSANTVEIEVTEGGGWLVVPQTWDGGWRAWVDGAAYAVARANGLQQVVALPQTAARVQLRYRPVGLDLGLVIGGVMAMALAAGAALERRRGPSPHAA